MKEIKKSLGTFDTMAALEKFLVEDNELPYHEKGYRRKVGINKVRNAFVKDHNQVVWFASKGYGMEFYFSEESKNQRCGF